MLKLSKSVFVKEYLDYGEYLKKVIVNREQSGDPRTSRSFVEVVGIPWKRVWQSVTANGRAVWNKGTFVAGVSGVSDGGDGSLYITFKVDPGM